MPSELKYESIAQLTESDALKRLESAKSEVVVKALYAATKYGEDWKWVQDACLAAIRSPSLPVRWAAATCLGDLAFLRRQIDIVAVTMALEQACNDPEIADPAKFSLSMVKQFTSHSAAS